MKTEYDMSQITAWTNVNLQPDPSVKKDRNRVLIETEEIVRMTYLESVQQITKKWRLDGW